MTGSEPEDGGDGAAIVADPQAMLDLAVGFMLFMVTPVLAFSVSAPADDSLAARVEHGSTAQLTGVVALLLFALVRRAALPLRTRPIRALVTYVGFLVVWIPFAMVLYPYLVRQFGHELVAQNTILYLESDDRGPGFYFVLILACVGAPVAEEVFFRGFLFRAIEGVATPLVALVVTSLLFGLAHEPMFAVPVGALGMVFGYLRMKTGGVGSSILAHIVHNTWTVTLVLFFPDLVKLVYDK